jgi:RimJ/RimL family protein N-acetyltransferase
MRHPTDSIQTERLALRRFTPQDLDPLSRLYSDPEVTRYIGGLKTREQAAEMLHDRILAYYDQHPGLGVWATEERAGGAFIGIHLLNHIHGEPDIQVGYVLSREHWGRGYATEMCVALLRYGFAELGLPRIVAITDRPNVASQRVLIKAGLHRNGERTLPHPHYASCNPLAWFERDAADWLAEHPS